jgi:F-type H+-transporting ATPase subunit b
MTAPSQVAMAASTGQAAVEHEQTVLGLGPPGIVAFAMIVVIVLMVWKKVPQLIGRGLDAKIATIRKQLDEAAALRAEAEAMRAEMQKKATEAHQDAEAILKSARTEASQLVAQAKVDADLLIERRAKMAEDKIAAAERSAIADVRARAASAATSAAAAIIAQRHDAGADKALVDRTIAGLN